MYFASIPDFNTSALNFSISVCCRGVLNHWRWFFVNRAKAVAPTAIALMGALKTPPDAETCGPIFFILSYIYNSNSVAAELDVLVVIILYGGNGVEVLAD